MSDGFAGSGTKQSGGFIHEVETRMKRLDVFTDQFGGEGMRETIPGQDTSKGKEYQKPHDDSAAELAAAGNAREQAEYDAIDDKEGKDQAGIKSVKEAFPMKKLESASDNAAFDVHLTDPARLSASIENRFQRRLSSLAAETEYKGWKIRLVGKYFRAVSPQGQMYDQEFGTIEQAKRFIDQYADRA